MKLVSPSTKLADIAIAEPAIIPTLNRLGLSLGLGDATVESSAESLGMETPLLLAIINTCLTRDYFPEDTLRHVEVPHIISYLQKTDNYYSNFQLPNIERHFNALMRSDDGGEENNLQIMKRFFDELKTALLRRIDDDINRWFPAILAGSQCQPMADGPEIADMAADLLSMLVIHLRGDYDQNLSYAVVVAVNTLETDIRKNDRIRERILIPLTATF